MKYRYVAGNRLECGRLATRGAGPAGPLRFYSLSLRRRRRAKYSTATAAAAAQINSA